jgi:ABC-type antimicrobial peptide transport system permease subunit
VAVGATSGQIIALVLRQGMVLTLIGVGIGAVASIALRSVISGFLFGVTANDGLTFLTVLLLFGTVAFLSALVPARRAARIDPTLAFRSE